MSRCIQLAKNGLGTTYPNPLVGSVVVHNEKIIGEGWHYKAGQPHAEVNAIKSVSNHKDLLEASTLYVNLEPCSHFGKTPPCSDLIITSGIKKVVIGNTDPNPEVAGRGIKKLQEAGCEVISGVLEIECSKLNKRFFTFHKKKRPYIFLKWAQTADGFIAPKKSTRRVNRPVWITNEYTRQMVHKMRAEEMSILVGTNTVLEDNPSLTVRDWAGKNPIRIVIDKNLKILSNFSVFDQKAPTIIFAESDNNLAAQTIGSKYINIDFSKEIASQICNLLYQNGIQSVIVEGGSKTLQTFIDANLWDEAHVFSGNITFGQGIMAPNFKGDLISKSLMKSDLVQYFKNQKS